MSSGFYNPPRRVYVSQGQRDKWARGAPPFFGKKVRRCRPLCFDPRGRVPKPGIREFVMLQRVILSGVLIVLALGLPACSQQEAVPKAVQQAESGKGSATSNGPAVTEFNVGDAETSIELILELDPASAAPEVKEERVLNAKRQLNQSNVTISKFGVSELWARIRIHPTKSFEGRVVVLRGVLERDNQPIASFQTLLGKYATEDDPAHPKVFRVNVAEGLPTLPNSMLLFARAEVLLLPLGTPEEGVDLANVTVEQGDLSAKISNPLRVTLQLPPPSPLAIPAPAAEAAPAATPAPAAEAPAAPPAETPVAGQ